MNDFQRASSVQGAQWEHATEAILLVKGWTINQRRWREPISGCEIDIVATDAAGQEHWIECKGSWQGPEHSKGLRRGDTTKKAVAVAYHLMFTVPDSARRPYIIIASHAPAPRTLAAAMIATAQAVGAIADVWTVPTSLFTKDAA